MKKIYLDYAATTPVDKEVLKEMLPYFSENFGNAMSIHSFGQDALQAVDCARGKIASFFGATPSEIIFTSGATEANNITIKGVLKSYYSQFATNYESSPNVRTTKNIKPHIITTAFEHHCVLDSCKAVEKENLAEVSYINPGKDGLIEVSDIAKAIKSNTILISVMYVNNEIGTVQPIEKIGKLVKKINATKKESEFKLLFHTDATQAVNYFECNVTKLGVDLLSMSAHKIYGPKGVGMLFVKKGTAIKKIQDGGDQEYKMRAGTHNVPGIVGFGKAIEKIQDTKNKKQNMAILKLRDYLIEKVLREISDAKLNGSRIMRSPNNANFSFADVEGEGLLLSLDMEGVACSTGSACSSGALSPSHVLLSIGLKAEQAHGSLRFTIGKYTTKQEIDMTVKKLKIIITRLRKISGSVLTDYYSKK
ncbi:MAG: Cysteine desulfurase [Candidatus Moranbacteria bacterium GW2011_GWA2_39_41]|nr:MAG: Cysteine desulfurase [Candidatus Moranbacteria bacterium GW2011_GWA2_39_41]